MSMPISTRRFFYLLALASAPVLRILRLKQAALPVVALGALAALASADVGTVVNVQTTANPQTGIAVDPVNGRVHSVGMGVLVPCAIMI